jgi:hypothetical protein
MSISHIPKGTLKKICFGFLWIGRKATKGIPLVKWTRDPKKMVVGA